MADMASKAQPLRCLIDPDDDLFMTPNAMVDRIGAYCEKTGQYVPKTHGEVARCVYESLAMGKSYDQISRTDYIPMKSDDFYGYRRKAMSKFYDFLRMYGRV